MSVTKGTETPLEDLSDRALRDRKKRAERVIREVDAADPAELARQRKTDEAISRMEAAIETVESTNAEIARRQHQGAIENIPLARLLRDAMRRTHPATGPLRDVARFAHAELQGSPLVASRLSDDEAGELAALVKRRLAVARGQDGAEPLTDAEEARYEAILGVAAGDEHLFQHRRAKAAAREKIADLGKARKRHPEAESLVAAVFGDPDLFDLLHERIRHNVRTVDEYGREKMGATTGRIIELENVSTLFVVLSRIGENGGRAITITQHGGLGDGLPLLPVKSLRQLQRNRWLTVRAEGAGFRVGVGSRVRTVAKRWEIALPEEDPRDTTSA